MHGIIILAIGAGYESRLEWRFHVDMESDFKSGNGWGVNRSVGGILTATLGPEMPVGLWNKA